MADTTYTLEYTAGQINRRLDLINENRNFLPYKYAYSELNSSLEDVGDGSFLTTADTSAAVEVMLATGCVLPEGNYKVSIYVTDITDTPIPSTGFSLKIDGTSKTSGQELNSSTSPLTISLVTPDSGFSAGLLIKPMIRKTDDTDTTWVPYMDKIGSYVDERFNGTNSKIKLLASSIDTSAKFESDLVTHYNIGKITDASGTNPRTIEAAGKTLREVFDWLFNMDEVQPSITQPPSVSCSFSSDASDERGTTISSVSYSITFNDGEYTNASSTGVSMTSYSFSSGTASSTTDTTGTLTLPSTYTVGSSPDFSTTLTANHSQGTTAKTNLDNDSNPIVCISSGSKTATPTFSKAAVDYPYYVSSDASTMEDLSRVAKFKKATSLESVDGLLCDYSADAYVWIFVRKGNSESQPIKTIEAYSDNFNVWGTFLEGTQPIGEIIFAKENSVEETFYAYRTKITAAEAGSVLLRLL